MPGDQRTLLLTRIDRPAVGGTFFIWLDDPENPLVEYWRQSSAIRSIHPLTHEQAARLLGPQGSLDGPETS